jgi:anti-sigma factor RsiW
MSRLDDALREALRREDPPEGFTERVLARIERRPEQQAPWRGWLAGLRAPSLRWATAFAAAGLVIGSYEYRAWKQEQIKGEKARDEVMLALRITGSKLRFAESKVQRVLYVQQ